MIIEVLGLGESLSNYKPNKNITVGVNDIFKYHSVNHLLLVDPPNKFVNERFETIIKSMPEIFYSNRIEWHQYIKCKFKTIEMTKGGRGIIHSLDTDNLFCHSNNSPYVACILAYKLGATKIIMHGVDFKTHHAFNKERPDMMVNVLKHFSNLYKEFNKRKVSLFVGSEISALSQVVPVQKIL